MKGTKGIVASGHTGTSNAARQILAEGGNAFDAALGALAAATVCEPMLTSLAGGGFMVARPAKGDPTVFDFFVQTPSKALPGDDLDFYPVEVDFGSATQEFHVGLGSMAVPGVVAGLFEAHEKMGSLPFGEIMAPAIALAKDGVTMTPYQAGLADVLKPILDISPAATAIVATLDEPTKYALPGAVVHQPGMTETLEALVSEGRDYFYRGPIAQQIVQDCRERGGQLTLADMEGFEVIQREPLLTTSHGAKFCFNPPPSPGGSLVAFALALLEPLEMRPDDWGGVEHCQAVVGAMHAASRLRRKLGAQDLENALAGGFLHPSQLDQWRSTAMPQNIFSRGTTHLSVVDEHGNIAALTSSNGEGCGYVIPGTGVMMNNMLGEEDLNPDGFHRWQPNSRLASMMSPTLARLADGSLVALGTGGANRIRSAVLQVLFNLFEFGMPLDQAVSAPRLHLEQGHLSFEAGLKPAAVDAMQEQWPGAKQWPEPSHFFGGVHAVERLPDGRLRGAGDPRRGGVVAGWGID